MYEVEISRILNAFKGSSSTAQAIFILWIFFHFISFIFLLFHCIYYFIPIFSLFHSSSHPSISNETFQSFSKMLVFPNALKRVHAIILLKGIIILSLFNYFSFIILLFVLFIAIILRRWGWCKSPAASLGQQPPNVQLIFTVPDGVDYRRFNPPACNGDDSFLPNDMVVK